MIFMKQNGSRVEILHRERQKMNFYTIKNFRPNQAKQ